MNLAYGKSPCQDLFYQALPGAFPGASWVWSISPVDRNVARSWAKENELLVEKQVTRYGQWDAEFCRDGQRATDFLKLDTPDMTGRTFRFKRASARLKACTGQRSMADPQRKDPHD